VLPRSVSFWVTAVTAVTTISLTVAQTCAESLFDGAHPVHLRVAEHKRRLYLDLCDDR
jgi:hypothetical protein